MKICLWCGGEILELTSRARLFCSDSCANKFYVKMPLNIRKHYAQFRNLVRHAETYEEFKTLYKKYFV